MHPLLMAIALVITGQVPACPDDPQPPMEVESGVALCAAGVPLPLDVEGERGVRIATLDTGHPLARQGLRAGDVIFRIAGERVRTGDEAVPRLQAALKARDALINFRRDGLPLLLRTGRTPE